MSAIMEGCWFFLVCWLLAELEIQIEGPHGWGEKLPTWRWESPALLKITNGKPVTGYHVYLTAFLIAMLHAPLLFTGFSRAVEARVLSTYFLMTVVWDFQWFVWNPAWGVRRYFSEKIWWFPKRLAGFPAEYYTGAAASFLVQLALWPEGVRRWLEVFAVALILSAAAAAASTRLRPRSRH